MRRRFVVLLAITLGVVCPAHAQGDDGAQMVPVRDIRRIEDVSLEDLLEMPTASVSKLEQPARETPALMSVVTKDQIDLYGWISINDVLDRQPGFAPSQDYNRPTVTARGLFESSNNDHLLLLIDGVPYNDIIFGTAYTWEVTPLFFVQTMDIVRGPGSALYGSNATNGVIAINSVSPTGNTPFIDARLRIGNANTQIYDVYGGQQFRLFAFTIGYNHYNTNGNSYTGYDGSGRTDASGKLAQFPIGDARSSDYVFAKLEGNGKLRGLSLQLHVQSWNTQSGHGLEWYAPDQPESLAENREILSLAYRPPALAKGRFKQEYVLQYQRHGMDWQVRHYPDNTSIEAIDYPNGVTENLDTDAHQIFARAQYTWNFWREMSLLGGVEDSLFMYFGDSSHTANADLNKGGTLLPQASTTFALRPWLEYVQDKPVDNFAVFLQLTTGRFLHRKLSITAGGRYDLQNFSFTDLSDPAHPALTRNLSQVSPRLAVVLFPWRDLVLKAMVDRAFRAPSPAELFAANTLITISNPKNLLPESITTVGFGAEDLVTRFLDLRADWFYEIFENEIANSVVNGNSSTNVYSRTVTGVEAEALFDYPIGSAARLGAFANYTFMHLVGETIHDPTTFQSSVLTWAPAHVFNIGASLQSHGFSLSLQGHYQGMVNRRASDNLPIDYSMYRPAAIADWFRLDARVAYQIADWIQLGVQGTNLTNSHGTLIKVHDFPFDYQIDGLRVLGTMTLTLGGLVRPTSPASSLM